MEPFPRATSSAHDPKRLITVLAGHRYISLENSPDVYYASCHKCGGSGLWYGYNGWAYNCYGCKAYGCDPAKPLTKAEAEKRADRLNQEQAMRDQKRAEKDAEWEAKRKVWADEKAEKQKQYQKERESRNADAKFIGEVGVVLDVQGTVVHSQDVYTQYGTSRLLLVKVDDTVIVKVFTTSEWAIDIDKGDWINLTGKVKSHDEWNGSKTTVLTRCKLNTHTPAVLA